MSEDMEDQAVYDINVDVTAVLGTASLLVNQLLKLGTRRGGRTWPERRRPDRPSD